MTAIFKMRLAGALAALTAVAGAASAVLSALVGC